MLVGICNRLVIYLNTGALRVHFNFHEYCKADHFSLSSLFRKKKKLVYHKLQNVVTNPYYVVSYTVMEWPDVNRPFPIPQTGFTSLSVYLSDTCLKFWALLIPLSHTLSLGTSAPGLLAPH